MGRSVARVFAGVLVGVIAAWAVIMLCEFASTALHRPPAGIDLRDPQQLATFIRSAPVAAMALVLAGWTFGALAGGAVAARIGQHRTVAALLVGALVVAGVIANSLLIPHPVWMTALGVVLPLPAAWLGARLVRPRATAH